MWEHSVIHVQEKACHIEVRNKNMSFNVDVYIWTIKPHAIHGYMAQFSIIYTSSPRVSDKSGTNTLSCIHIYTHHICIICVHSFIDIYCYWFCTFTSYSTYVEPASLVNLTSYKSSKLLILLILSELCFK